MKKIVLLFLLAGTIYQAQAQFTISGEFRPRAEYRNGYLQLADSSKTGYPGILGRSRISFDFSQEKISSRFSVQHAFVFGENNFSSDTITRNTLNIYEGWFRYSFSKTFSATVGRIALAYDDQRLIGVSNWKQWGATHDAVLVQVTVPGSGYRADLGLAVNNMAPASAYLNAYTLKNYKYMAFLWQQKKFFNDELSVSLTAILDVNQKPSVYFSRMTVQTYYVINGQDTIGSIVIPTTTGIIMTYPNSLYGRGTAGLHLSYNRKKLGITASGYYQAGHYKNGREISAYMLAGSVSFQIVKPFRLMIGDDFLSGNDYSDTSTMKNKLKGFSTLWGTNHSFYGYMDIFSSYIAKDALQYGLNNLYIRGTLTFSPKTSLELTYRKFSMHYGYLAETPFRQVDKNLGSEIDVMFLYKPFNNFELNAAYCYYFKSETRELIDGLKPGTGRNGQFAYLMLTYKPQFFSSDKK